MLTVAGVLDDLAEQAGGGRVENVHYYANAPTINVTVTWDNLTFTYDRGNWDPTTHTYADGTFEPSDGTTLEKGNQITVTSASSITIDAALTYTPVSPYETAAGYFTVAYDPESDRITKLSVEKNATGEAYLQLEGRLSDSISGTFTVGTVTVTITGGGKTGN